MYARLIHPTPAELEENDTYAGRLIVVVSVGLDESDGDVRTIHDLACVLLQCADHPLSFPENER